MEVVIPATADAATVSGEASHSLSRREPMAVTVWSNTAVLMPVNEMAHEQVDLLHAIEVNRGRGLLSYVETIDEAHSWFEEMARRV